jgi:hypothetical protein
MLLHDGQTARACYQPRSAAKGHRIVKREVCILPRVIFQPLNICVCQRTTSEIYVTSKLVPGPGGTVPPHTFSGIRNIFF